MAQVSYGTITITDTNDIRRIYMQYCRSTSNQLSGTTVPGITVDWSESTPAWVDKEYIWQRAVIEKSGTLDKTYGTPVCITGAQGEMGDQGPQGPQGGTGAAGRSLTSTTTQYTTAATSATITQNNMGSYTWSDNVPDYNANTPAYWVRITNVYSNPSSTEYIIYKDNGITDAVKTSHDANTTAAAANTTANNANTTANTANSTANSANTKADQAVTNVSNLQNKLKYYWVNEVSHTNGTSGWTKPNYPAGTYAASGISGTTFDSENSSTYGYNTWYANGINLRYNAIKLGELTGSALTFYQPSTTSQGAKAMELSGTALKFYASNGTTVQAEFGGDLAKVSGQLIAQSGYIGTNESNRWFIGNRLNYDQTSSAALVSYGTAYIQLGEDGCWRLSTNRLHTGWNAASGSNVLHYPKWNNIYWDFGIHVPNQNANKFIYIRNYDSTNSGLTEAQILQDLQNNFESNVSVLDSWQYRFYVTADGNLYARNLYVLDDNGQATQIGGTDGVYLLKSGGTITGDLTVNGTLTGTLSGTATRVSKDLKIQLNGGTTEGTNQFTYNGSTAKTINITKSSVGLSNVENTALSTWAGSSNLTTTKVGTLAAAAVKGVDTSITASSTSINLPTSKAVADLIRGYLPLTGGNVTGAVTFGSSVSVDELTAGDLVVNGNASFTNNLQANTINGVAVGSSPKFTDTNYYHTTGSWGGTNNLTYTATANGGAGALAFTLATATTGAYGVTKLSSATDSTSTTLAATASAVKAAYDLAASKTNNTGTVTSVQVQASSPLQSSSSTASSTTLNTTISFTNQNVNTILAGPSSGTTAAAPTFRKLVAADIPDISGTYYLASNPSGYTTNTGTVTSVRVQASSPLTSTVSTASSTTLDTTIKFSNQNKNLVLAGPSSSNTAAAPTFRSLVADDIPSISKSKISDFPTSLKNPNALAIKVYNGTSTSSDTSYDGNTSGQSVSVAGTSAITGITASAASGGSTTFTLTKANGGTSTFDVTVTASVATGATTLTDASGNTISKGSTTKPVYFSNGTPAEASTYAGGTAVTLNGSGKGASTASFYAPTSYGSSSQVLIGGGQNATPTWTDISGIVPSSATNATNATYATYDASEASNTTKTTIANKYIPKSIGTAAGDIIYWSASGTPTRLAKGSNGQVLKLANGVPTWGTDNNDNYYHTTGTWSGLTYTATANGGAGALAFTLPTASASASGVINTSAQVLAGKKTIKYTTRIYPMVGVSNEKSQWYKITFPYYNAETTSAAKWFMNSFDLHFGGGYNANANGVAHVAFYWTRAASNGAWAASQVAAKLDGILMNKITLYYRIAEPGVLYVNNSSNNYNGIWLDNLYVDDTSPSLDWSTTTIETCSAITVANYTEVPTVRTYNNNSSTYIIGNNTLPVSNNTYNLGSSDNKWANIYATTFNGALSGNATTASRITDITSTDTASSSTDWRKVWISYADGVTGRPAVTDGLTFQTSTNTLKATTFSGALSGNASTATKWASAQTVYVTLGTASTSTTIQGGSSSAQTIGVNGTLAIGNGGTGLTASPSMLTNLGSTSAANVLQASPRPGVTGTLGAGNGGTGQTSLINAANSLLNALSTGSSTPVDNDYYISQYVNGGTTTTTYHRRPMSALWSYISGKISSSGTYVTIATDQTITANQKTFNGAIRWGTSSKYGAAHYDSTLEAIVFSFA